LAYLIGSISSSCLVSYLAGRIDLRNEPDGRVSAALVYRKLGKVPFLCTVILDVALPVLAVALARLLTGSTTIMMLAGFAAVVGHNWSFLVHFKGGLGATAIAGALILIVTWYIFYGLLICGIVYFLTHKSSLAFAFGIVSISGVLGIQIGMGALAMFPMILFALMLLKRFQVARFPRTAQ